jgi:general secretion pathway protein A
MHAAFFGLTREPFSIAPDPHCLYLGERHREALAHLMFGLRGSGGFVVLTGEVGAGKTTLCRSFLEQVPQRCNVAYVFNPKLTALELLATICDEFGVTVVPRVPHAPTIKDHVDPLNAYLLRSHAVGHNSVLIIDEAQNLSADVLEQLRLLTNLETAERKLLQVVLIGQPELRDMLAQPALESLAQRVVARYHLEALSEAETGQYIRHRLAVAGLLGPPPFDPAAGRRIHRIARGVPRRINLLCDRAMLGGYARGCHRIDVAMVDQAAREVFGDDVLRGLPPADSSRAGRWWRGWHPAERARSPWGVALVAVAVLVAATVVGVVFDRQRTAASATGGGAAWPSPVAQQGPADRP